MTEAEALAWIETRFDPAKVVLLQQLVVAIARENEHQNLVSRSSLAAIWSRHIVDSAQLLDHAPTAKGTWVDIGTGAGFPGLVLALLCDCQMTLTEPRRRRATFLSEFVEAHDLQRRISVRAEKVERIRSITTDILSARAVAPLGEIFRLTAAIARQSTTYLLLRGPSVMSELATTQRAWQGTFHVEPSVTNPESGIVVATQVRPR